MSEDRGILASGAYGLDPHLAQIFGADGGQTQPFRGLATELLVRHVDKGRRGLAVCGAASGAGVSMLAAGLALALAQVGVDTLIVDANLRQPSLEGLIIGGNSANLCRCRQHDIGAIGGEPFAHRRLFAQVQPARRSEKFAVLAGQPADQRRADHAAITRNVNPLALKRKHQPPRESTASRIVTMSAATISRTSSRTGVSLS